MQSSSSSNMEAKLSAKTGTIYHPKVQRPREVFSAHSDEEEDSSDGDDSIHTSDEEFIEHDSELDPNENYACSTMSGSGSETATESSSETTSDGSSVVVSESGSVDLPGSNAASERGRLSDSNEASASDDCKQRRELTAKFEGMSLASTPGSTDEGGGGAILAWLNEQAQLEVKKMGNLIRDKFR